MRENPKEKPVRKAVIWAVFLGCPVQGRKVGWWNVPVDRNDRGMAGLGQLLPERAAEVKLCWKGHDFKELAKEQRQPFVRLPATAPFALRGPVALRRHARFAFECLVKA